MNASVRLASAKVRALVRCAALAAGVLAVAMLFVASFPHHAQAGQGTTLVVGASFIIRSIDPGRTVETTSNMLNHATYDSLVTFEGEDLKTPKPALATEWKISEDGKTYTFKLRPNVKFSGGNRMRHSLLRKLVFQQPVTRSKMQLRQDLSIDAFQIKIE